MINMEKVKKLYQLAAYDSAQEKKDRPMGRFFRNDYLARELLGSFFLGTFAYILLLVLLGMYQANEILESINTMDFLQAAIVIGLCYVAFLAVYLLITYIVYYVRYTNARKRLKKYYGRLYVLNHAAQNEKERR